MATLKETAKAYEPKHTKNIAELEKISVDLEVFDGEGKDKSGEVFKYKYAKIDGEEYRIAGSILGGIKKILERQAHIKFVQVLVDGQGMNTRYQVIPLVENPLNEEKVV